MKFQILFSWEKRNLLHAESAHSVKSAALRITVFNPFMPSVP